MIDNGRSEIMRRRSLFTAMHGIPHSSVIECIADHFANPSPEYESILELPAVLSSVLELRSTLMFRHNTTQAFRDAIEVVLFHELNHDSRAGEEAADVARILRLDFARAFSPQVGHLLYTDVDHPAIAYMAQQIWPSAAILDKLVISDLVYDDKEKKKSETVTEIVLERYLAQINNQYVSVVIIPHVVWFNGAVLDVVKICREIKLRHPLVTTIVDGAQAVGQIALNIETVAKENADIDFYLGCCHKWLCGPETVGFARVSRRYATDCKQCQQFLITSDQLTDSSSIALFYQGQQVGTNQRGLAKGFLQALKIIQVRKGGIQKVIKDIKSNADALRDEAARYKILLNLDPPAAMTSGIVSFTADDGIIDALQEKLNAEGFSPAVYPMPVYRDKSLIGKNFCRISPGPDLLEEDIQMISDIFREVVQQ